MLYYYDDRYYKTLISHNYIKYFYNLLVFFRTINVFIKMIDEI